MNRYEVKTTNSLNETILIVSATDQVEALQKASELIKLNNKDFVSVAQVNKYVVSVTYTVNEEFVLEAENPVQAEDKAWEAVDIKNINAQSCNVQLIEDGESNDS